MEMVCLAQRTVALMITDLGKFCEKPSLESASSARGSCLQTLGHARAENKPCHAELNSVSKSERPVHAKK